MPTYCISDFGARAGADATAALQAALDACARAGGGRVRVPAGGTHVCGTLSIGPRTELWVERGAVLQAAGSLDAFTAKVFDSGEEQDKKVWLTARDADDIAIGGGGVIDGNAAAFITADAGKIYRADPARPALSCFIGCRRLRIRDVTFRNSANWTLHFTGCEDVVVDGVAIYNDLKYPNCDGIDPDHCRNVRIANCHIEAGDDCIVIKNTRPFARFGPTENVVVTNCTLVSTSAAIKIGTESAGDFRNLIFSNCTITRSNRGLSIQLRDEGSIENVQFSNMVVETRRFDDDWWGCAEPVYVTAIPRTHDTRVGAIRNLRIHGIQGRSENGIFVMAHAPGGIRGVTLADVSLALTASSSRPGGTYDLRPCPPGILPAGARPSGAVDNWGCKAARPTAPVYLHNVHDIRLLDVRLRRGNPPVDAIIGGLECHGVENLQQERVEIDC
jgi:hypothetical protein